MAGTFHGNSHFELINNLKERFVIKSARVEQAMRAVDRRDFFTPFPYQDSDSPHRFASYGYTVTNPISAPYMHASALEILSSSLTEGATALDVGFGSGYLTTCMVGKSGRVVGIDRITALKVAEENVRKKHRALLKSGRVRFITGDGSNGYKRAGPYDAIYFGAGAEVVPTALLDQLKPGGTMLIPMCSEGGDQQMQQIVKEPNGVIRKYPRFKVKFGPKTEKEKGDDIPEQLQCPICFEVPLAEIYQCKNGHTICGLCEANVKECPQCRIPIPVNGELIRNRALESLLDNFSVLCPNQQKGCKEKLLKKNVKDHLSNCIHSGKRVQLCKKLFPEDSCNFWTNALAPSTSVFHFLSAHKAIKVMGRSVSTTVANIKLFANHSSSDVLWEPILLTYNGREHFMILTFLNGRDRSISWSCLNLDSYDENVEDYEVEYFIESWSKNVPHIKWTCPPLSLMNCMEVVSDLVFSIPIITLEKYYMEPIGLDLTILVSVKSSSGVHTTELAKSVTIRSDYILFG